jgi:integrase
MARKGGKDRGILFRPRPNGEAIGPNGRRGEWWARWYDGDGGEHREKAGTKSLAMDLFRRRKTEVRQGVKFPETMRQRDTRLKDLVADYLEAIRANQVKTAEAIEGRLTEVLGILGNVEAKTVKASDLERLKAKLTTASRQWATGTVRAITRKPATINHYLQDLKAVFCKAVKAEKLNRNPFLGVRLLQLNNKRARELSPEEEFRLFQAIPGDPPALRSLFRFLLETGAKAFEACDLTWRAVLWADSVAELPETKAGEKQYLVLSKAALAILEALPRNDPSVFCRPDGKPPSPCTTLPEPS